MTTRRMVVATAAFFIILGSPAGAAPGLPRAPSSVIPSIEQRLAPVRAKAQDLRRTLAAGSVSSAVRAAALASNQSDALRGIPYAPAPRTLEQAVRAITTAVRRAERIVRRSPAARLAEGFTLRQVLALTFSYAQHPDVLPPFPDPGSAPALRAGAIVARAIDAALPVLRREAARMPAPGARRDTAPECDVIDQSPTLCVGGLGNNEYLTDEEVLIDLGGDDTYRNSAGGAGVLSGLPAVAVNVDLSGNDVYDAGKRDLIAQGGAVVGGVGILVDSVGDDTYRVDIPGSGAGGGQGLGILGALGVFIDGSGSDTHVLNSVVEGDPAGAGGQGEGFFAGDAVFVDGGIGDDTYSIHALAVPKTDVVQDEDGNDHVVTKVGSSSVVGQGFGGIFGVGAVFFESGGTDSFDMNARVAPAAADAPPVLVTIDPSSLAVSPSAGVSGQGEAAVGGYTFFLEGPGDTTYSETATIDPIPVSDPDVAASAVGQGYGTAGGVAVLSDPSGNDRYTMAASMASSVAFTAQDGCSCDTPVASQAGPASAAGQGWGATGGLGLLADDGGNDAFAVDTSNASDVVVNDQRSSAGSPLQGDAEADSGYQQVQGAGYADGGVGALTDAGGDDSYSVSGRSTAHATGSAVLPDNAPALTSGSAQITLDAQGVGIPAAGLGALIDLGGKDAYSASASSSWSVGDDAPQVLAPVLHVQGAADPGSAVVGVLVDLDGAAADTFVQNPPSPACQGTRGQAVWVDCTNFGFGVNA